jgi:hypothetical protein
MTIYILYSADYELFLGGNYCNETEVLIKPTNNLLDLFDNLKIPITLFADIFSILRYKEQNLFNFPDNAENQLKDAIRRGHDVQSHVHPHWNFTQMEGNNYKVNLDYFLLGNLDNNRELLYSKIRNYLITSRIYLNDLLRQVNNNYNCIAFRSGGYGLQPNSNIVIKALIDSGFIIDSSIVPEFILKTNVNSIEFSIVPKMANYYLDYDLITPSAVNKGIFEIPIASCKFNLIDHSFYQIDMLSKLFQNKMLPGKLNNENQKGYGIQDTVIRSQHSKYYKFLKSLNNRFYYLDCSTNDEKMFQCTKKYLGQFDFYRDDIFFSFNMHPKDMTKEHFKALENYHNKLKIYYQDTIQSISYQDAADILMKKSI